MHQIRICSTYDYYFRLNKVAYRCDFKDNLLRVSTQKSDRKFEISRLHTGIDKLMKIRRGNFEQPQSIITKVLQEYIE